MAPYGGSQRQLRRDYAQACGVIAVTDHMLHVRRLFDAHASEWSAKYALGAPLAQRLARFAVPLLSLVPPPAVVLDLGCGTGNLASHLAAAGYHVRGLEISGAMLEIAGRSNGSRDIEWVRLEGDFSMLPCSSGSCDAVVASSVLEYVDRLEFVISECARVLRPGGILLCTVPDPTHPVRRAESVFRAIAKGPVSWLRRMWPSRVRMYLDYLHGSKNRIRLERWRSLARNAGFETLRLADHGDGRSPLALLAFRRIAGSESTA